eukprot:138908_1
MSTRDVYIVECVRTPLGRGKKTGCLQGIRPVDLLSQTLSAVVTRANLDSKYVEDVVTGCVLPHGEQGGNIARLALLKAGFPVTVPGVQLNRACGSGQQAVHFISQAIACGDMEIGIASGIEMLSVNSMPSLKPKAFTKLKSDFPYPLISQHDSAERVALKYNISREDCNQFAYESHTKAGIARDNGYFKKQIIEINNAKSGKVIYNDEGIRYPSNLNAIRKLPSLFNKNGLNNGVVSAGTASQITDGASAILLASLDAVKKFDLNVKAKVISRVVIGSDPILMLDGVITATKLCLNKVNMNVNDIDLFEVNEAFACVPLCWLKTLKVDKRKLNICGGALAHGHPLGATGSILMTKLVNDLERTNKMYGLQTMCIGWGMATATIIKRCSNVNDDIRAKL